MEQSLSMQLVSDFPVAKNNNTSEKKSPSDTYTLQYD